MFLLRTPSPRLAPFVEHLWYYERVASVSTEAVLPTARMQLIVGLSEAPGAALAPLVTGVATRPVVIDTAPMRRIVGAVFRPGGAGAFLEAPCDELRDQDVELELLWGSSARDVRERLATQPSPAATLDTLDLVLRERLSMATLPGLVEASVHLLERGEAVGDIVDTTGASRSRLVRTFRRFVGTTPKRYASLARFQRAVRILSRGAQDHAELALALGYFDQAHFAHEFRRFAGRSPTAYRPRDPDEPNHVLV